MSMLDKSQFLKPGATVTARKLRNTASFRKAMAETLAQQEKIMASQKMSPQTWNRFVGKDLTHP